MIYIYLDENKWIDLRNEKSGIDLAVNYYKIKEQVEAGNWILPLSHVHLEETLNTGNDELRIKLAEIQIELSLGYSIPAFYVLRNLDIEQLNQEKRKPTNVADIIKKDIHNAWGASLDKIIEDALQEENLAKIDREHFKTSYKSLYRSIIPIFANRNKKEITFAEKQDDVEFLSRLQSFCMNGTKTATLLDFLYHCVPIYFKDKQDVVLASISSKAGTADRQLELFRTMPTFYSNCALLYRNIKVQARNKPFHKNDFIDTLFLSVAIPYCDIIVTEKKWCNLAHQENLDKIYSTKFVSSLDELSV